MMYFLFTDPCLSRSTRRARRPATRSVLVQGAAVILGTGRAWIMGGAQMPTRRKQGWVTTPPLAFSSQPSVPPWDLGTGGGESLRLRRSAEGRWGTVPEPRMVGRALGGRDPVRELLLPPRLVPPPLHVSCREESWPGMEMDLAVDGGLGKTERGVTGVPQLGVRRRRHPMSLDEGRVPGPPPTMFRTEPPPPGGLHQHSRLEAGVSREQEHSNGDLCKSRGDQPHPVQPSQIPHRCLDPLFWLQMSLDSDPISVPCWPW